MKIDLTKLKEKEKYIKCQKHPTADLLIWNYTQNCQFDKAWDEYTLMCRGLITDLEGNVKAKPFNKFFNYGEKENQEIPNTDFKIYEKYDGSLGILYWIDDKPFLATRGSFDSDQALKGTEILNNKELSQYHFWFDKSKTYLFEIIYPQNRIVIDYGKEEKLILLAVIDTETGKDIDFSDTPFNYALEVKGVKDFTTLTNIPKDNSEGFVIVWENGFRLKMKYDEYVRLHRVLTSFSARHIWDCLRNKQDVMELIKDVPDEFFDWVKEKKEQLESNFFYIKDIVEEKGKEIKKLSNRKLQAIEIMKNYKSFSGEIFAYLDGKDYEQIIWKKLKPKYEVPFKEEI